MRLTTRRRACVAVNEQPRSRGAHLPDLLAKKSRSAVSCPTFAYRWSISAGPDQCVKQLTAVHRSAKAWEHRWTATRADRLMVRIGIECRGKPSFRVWWPKSFEGLLQRLDQVEHFGLLKPHEISARAAPVSQDAKRHAERLRPPCGASSCACATRYR